VHRRNERGAKLFDSLRHAPEVDAELFVVEGDSAAEAVCAVRNVGFQAVLPIQGKPTNALRASRRRILANPWLAAFTAALGNAAGTALPLGELRYRRLLLLLDPDADGIHTGALLQIFLHQFMRPLFERRQVEIVHAPWGEIRAVDVEPLLAFHEAEFQRLCREQRSTTPTRLECIRHRGVGTITPTVLERTCINPTTRRTHVLTTADVEAAIAVFGGEARRSSPAMQR